MIFSIVSTFAKAFTVGAPQIVVLLVGLAAIFVALSVAKTVVKVLLLIVGALAVLYFFFPAAYASALAAIF